MLRSLDAQLNKLTMYSLVLWVLRIMAAATFVLSLTGALPYSIPSLAVSLLVLILVAWSTNEIFGRIWKVPTNFESYAITAVILYLILPPATSVLDVLVLALGAVVAIASKFIVTTHGRHLLNPAAFGAVLLGLFGLTHASWWIGSSVIWWLTLPLGLLVVRKIRRFSLVLAFAGTALAILIISTLVQGHPVAETLKFSLISSPLIFLATIMLTEPSTMPGHRRQQVIYGALVGAIYALPFNLGPVILYPETALIIGNLYAFLINPHFRLRLTLKAVEKFGDRVASYTFVPDHKPEFEPGQYMEWTLSAGKPDMRGNRRTFSIASSPTEADVMLGVKFYNPSSKYKTALKALQPGNKDMFAGAVAGDFTLPKDTSEKLAFIAGGIGITPFRSMLKYVIDTKQQRDIVMIYTVSDPTEVAYKDVLNEAAGRGIRVITLLTGDPAKAPASWRNSTGQLTADFITTQVPDHSDRAFYVSGPQPMVETTKDILSRVGVKAVKTDYFTGY